jgi:hypothetical protein
MIFLRNALVLLSVKNAKCFQQVYLNIFAYTLVFMITGWWSGVKLTYRAYCQDEVHVHSEDEHAPCRLREKPNRSRKLS